MALFNRGSTNSLDDTEKLICTVENAQNINKHTEYNLRVQRGPSKENRWNVSHRFRDFAALHSILQQSNIELPLPPKKLIGNMQPTFIAERQIALQNYINEVLKHQILALSLQVRCFLDPRNYSTPFAEHALQTVSIALRGDGRYELKGPLHDIGWRIRKHYFLDFSISKKLQMCEREGCLMECCLLNDNIIMAEGGVTLRLDWELALNSKVGLPEHTLRLEILMLYVFCFDQLHISSKVTNTESKVKCMLSWQNYGPDRCLSDKDLQTAFKSLQSISHPYIDQILAIQNLNAGAYVVRRIHECGTVRDILYGTEYSKSYLIKYGNPRVRKPFTSGQIAHYGYQILQALKFLHEKGLPHGHLHPGNIAIENQRVQLLDIENILFGGAALYRPYLLQLRRTSAESVDVYSFARTLYEMAFAATFDDYYCDDYPECDVELESILRLCLSSTACKHGQPSIDELLQHSFFSRAPLNGLTRMAEDSRAHLKFSIALKEELKNAIASCEARLKNEQKLERSARREVRIQEILGSEEEMKKQRRRARKRDSVWKSTSSLAETVRSHSASTASSPTPPALSAESGGAVCGSPAGSPGTSSSRAGVPEAGSPRDGVPGTGSPRDGVPAAASGGEARSALLGAICAFDKSKLSRVTIT